MTVYFIQPEDGGLVKIGYTSKDPEIRLKELQTGSPSRLVILATEPGDELHEKFLHSKFSHLRVSGEWFRPSIDLISRVVNGANESQQQILKAYARSYQNCLWSHCLCNGTDKDLVNILYMHARHVDLNASECWEFLRSEGVESICWKHCQYFFSLCWPNHRPYMKLTSLIVKRFINEKAVSEQDLELLDLSLPANTRPIVTRKFILNY